MNIALIVRQKTGACEWYRLLLPFKYLNEKFISNNIQITIIPERLLNFHLVNYTYDLIIMTKHSVRFLNILKLKSKAKIIIDVDDDYTFNPTFNEFIKNADCITTTNERLKNNLEKINSNVTVFENAIPYKDERFIINKINNIFNIGYLGHNSHACDLEIINGFNISLNEYINNYNLTLYGYTENSTYKKYIEILTCENNKNFNVVNVVNIEDFFQLYNNITISLAPLINSDFNISKSNLKFTEAALSNSFFIGSNIATYSDVVINGYNGFLANNKKEFIDYTIEIYKNTNKYKYILDNARKTIYEKLDFYKIQEKRFNYLIKILNS